MIYGRSRYAGLLYSTGLSFGLPNDVDGREEADPDHVDEVPVDRRGLDSEVPPRGELTLERPVEHDDVEDHAAGHVRAVKTGQREEHAGEDAVTRQEPELRVLVALADKEENAQHDRRDQPIAKRSAVAALDRVHGDLHGHARHEQLDRVDRREPDAEDRVDLPRGFLAEDGLPLGD